MSSKRCATCQFFFKINRGSLPHWTDPYNSKGSCTFFDGKPGQPFWAYSGYRVEMSAGSFCEAHQEKKTDETAHNF
jgi:hypothetical protein